MDFIWLCGFHTAPRHQYHPELYILYQPFTARKRSTHHLECTLVFKTRLGDTSNFCGDTDTLVLDFWWYILWLSKPEFAALFALGGDERVTRSLRFTSDATPADFLAASSGSVNAPQNMPVGKSWTEYLKNSFHEFHLVEMTMPQVYPLNVAPILYFLIGRWNNKFGHFHQFQTFTAIFWRLFIWIPFNPAKETA